jgi:acyl-CoA thioester hydrolase
VSTSVDPVWEFRSRRRIEFADTDMGGIVHFSRFFIFMETAEHDFLRSLGTSVHTQLDGQEVGWPRVEASCQFLSPVSYGDEVEIRLRVVRKGERSMTYEFAFLSGERLVCRGRMSSVCCVLNDPDGLRAIPIPDVIADRIQEAPANSRSV